MRLRLNRMALIRSYFKTRAAIRLGLCKNRPFKIIVVHIFFSISAKPTYVAISPMEKKEKRKSDCSKSKRGQGGFILFLFGWASPY